MSRLTILVLIFQILTSALTVNAATLAYWRFETGPDSAILPAGFSALDISGNGNHLAPWTAGGSAGFSYSSDIASEIICSTGADNNYSVRNTGNAPALVTRSVNRPYGSGSYPSGVNLETVSLRSFTVEAYFKPENNSSYRTIVGRDARYVGTTDPKQSAFYLQIRNDHSLAVIYNDVTGTQHIAASAAGLITGFDFTSDPAGATGRWYYAAAVSDGVTLSLYLANATAGTDPMLVGSADLTVSSDPTMAIGTTSGTSWHAGGWSVGRGLYNGSPTDYAYGFIDEVRISDVALTPGQFLMMPKQTIDRNPVFNAADPHIFRDGYRAYIYPTSGASNLTYAYYSNDLVSWYRSSSLLNFNNISWIPSGKNCWAPCIIKRDNKYYLYYSVGPKPSSIGVAVSYSPTGPFTDSGAALISDEGASWFEAIDPMVFQDPQSGIYYFYFGGSSGARLRVFKLNDDMVTLGDEVPVNNPTSFTEGVFMHYYKGLYHLTYSRGYWKDSTYSVRYSTSTTPVGPWTYRGTILKSDTWFKGPGHHSIMHNPLEDQWYICYHRWNEKFDNGPYDGGRSTAIEKLYYDENNLIMPVIQTDSGVGPVQLGDKMPGDFDQSGFIDNMDMIYLMQAWLTGDNNADIAPSLPDGIVNLRDTSLFFGKYWQEGSDKGWSNLIGHWTLDESSGIYAGDASAYGNAGVLIGSPSRTTGRIGRCLNFDGVDDRVVIDGCRGVRDAYPRTVTAFIKAASDVNNQNKDLHCILSWGSSLSGSMAKWFVSLDDGTGKLALGVYGARLIATGANSLEDGQWHHIAVVLPDGADNINQVEMYIDGVEVTTNSGSLNATLKTAFSEVSIGSVNTSTQPGIYNLTQPFKGLIDDVRLYNSALTQPEIAALADMP